MAPAVAESPAENAAFAALDEQYARLPIDQIVPSKTNPRKHFDGEYLAQLAGSVREKGVIEPLIVRPLTPTRGGLDRFEIVAGECRYKASKIAALTHLPAIIRALTDEQALECQLEENIHRNDLTPLEQAAGYRALITANPDKHNIETIATRIGMSPSHVWDRLKLLDLIGDAKQILEQERMAAGHAILIARLKPEDQQRVIEFNDDASTQFRGVGLWRHDSGFNFDEDDPANKGKKPGKWDGVKPCSVRELDAWIRDHIRFDPAHAAKAQPLVFEETAAKVEEAAAAPGRGKKVISITHSYRVADDARDEKDRTYGSESWERADGEEKSKTCDHSVLGVVVAGDGYGETLQVCVARDKCQVHFAKVIQQREKNAKLREAGQGKKAAKNEKRQEHSWERDNQLRQEAQKRWDAFKAHAIEAVVAKIRPVKFSDKVLQGIIDERLTDGYASVGDRTLFAKLLGGTKITTKNFTRALAIVDVMSRDNTREFFQPIAKKYGVDLAKLEKAHAPKPADPKPSKKGKAAA